MVSSMFQMRSQSLDGIYRSRRAWCDMTIYIHMHCFYVWRTYLSSTDATAEQKKIREREKKDDDSLSRSRSCACIYAKCVDDIRIDELIDDVLRYRSI